MFDLRVARFKPFVGHLQTRIHIRTAKRLNRFNLPDYGLLVFDLSKAHNRIGLTVEGYHSNRVAVG